LADRVLKNNQNEKWKGVRIDLQTANLIGKVQNSINQKQKDIIIKMAEKNIKQLITLLWGLVKK
jgi:hypothetical protein